jgi:hypothetical protein
MTRGVPGVGEWGRQPYGSDLRFVLRGVEAEKLEQWRLEVGNVWPSQFGEGWTVGGHEQRRQQVVEERV